MKIVPNKIYSTIFFGLTSELSLAAPTDPPPPPVPPPPPGLSIDSYVIVGLFIGSIIIFKVLKRKKITV
jgi:hypothetical protein